MSRRSTYLFVVMYCDDNLRSGGTGGFGGGGGGGGGGFEKVSRVMMKLNIKMINLLVCSHEMALSYGGPADLVLIILEAHWGGRQWAGHKSTCPRE